LRVYGDLFPLPTIRVCFMLLLCHCFISERLTNNMIIKKA